jgi:tetratricopeptide (TPR) repeat protein
MRNLKELVDAYGESAESLHLLARVYEEEGELDLAEKYYLAALGRAGGLRVPEEMYAISYRLSELYYKRKSYKKYEDILVGLVSGQEAYTQPRYERLRGAYVSTLMSRGFDELLLMYRLSFDFAQEAHRELGAFYCRTGRARSALLHLAFSNLAVFSTLADELKAIDPEYSFTGLRDALTRAAGEPRLGEFLRSSGAFKGLYFLGSALFSLGVPQEARKIWQAAADFGAGEWRTQSRSQLLAPKAEPLITY